MAMTALARDLYSRQPDGSREFEDLLKTIGLKFTTVAGEAIPVVDLLQKR
jgi:hypothetical protein